MTSPNHISSTTQTQIILLILGAIFLRVLVGSGPYSGHPGMDSAITGDLEAQRHWIDLTFNVPAQEWYIESCSSDDEYYDIHALRYCNDLEYWGLDYPPLTGFHSWIMGVFTSLGFGPKDLIGSNCVATEVLPQNPSIIYPWIVFMRMSSLIADLIIYFPAAFFLVYKSKYSEPLFKKINPNIAFAALIYFPGLILIDHGHFQYNSISLGFFIWSIWFIHNKSFHFGSISFLLGLFYKQMNLYYAPAIFSYFLHLWFPHHINQILQIGATVIFTFLFVFSSWIIPLFSSTSSAPILSVFHRVFPVSRGLFEDKVASFWCTFDPIFKLSQHPFAFKITLLTVLALIVPINYFWPQKLTLSNSFRRNSKSNSVNPSTNTHSTDSRKNNYHSCDYISLAWLNSIIFFLFSFHVHEKTILVPILPMMVFALYNNRISEVIWLSFVSTYSMAPLLFRESIIFPTIILPIIFTLIIALISYQQHVHRLTIVIPSIQSTTLGKLSMLNIAQIISILPYFAFFVCMAFVNPPSHLPFLFPYLITSWTCILLISHLLLHLVFRFKPQLLHKMQFQIIKS